MKTLYTFFCLSAIVYMALHLPVLIDLLFPATVPVSLSTVIDAARPCLFFISHASLPVILYQLKQPRWYGIVWSVYLLLNVVLFFTNKSGSLFLPLSVLNGIPFTAFCICCFKVKAPPVAALFKYLGAAFLFSASVRLSVPLIFLLAGKIYQPGFMHFTNLIPVVVIVLLNLQMRRLQPLS